MSSCGSIEPGITARSSKSPTNDPETAISQSLPTPPDPIVAATSGKRIPELDILRGFAVLGIFIMNIIGFAMPIDAYYNPAIAGGTEGADLVAFYVQDAFFDGRMRAIFCLLFGASLALFVSRANQQGAEGARRVHQRYLWLVAIGMAHTFLLQNPGDILFEYGLVALLIWSVVGAAPRKLLVAGISLITIVAFLGLADELSAASHGAEMTELQSRVIDGIEVSDEEQTALDSWAEEDPSKRLVWEQADAQSTIESMQAATTWTATWSQLSEDMIAAITISPDSIHFLTIAGTMLLGVALFRSGILTGGWSTKSYIAFIALGLLAALATHLITRAWATTGFVYGAYLLDALWTFSYEPFRILVALGWISALLLLSRAFTRARPMHWLAQTGRMALTVYLLETLLATTLFYAWGFGLFGELSRFQVLSVAGAILVVLVIFANLWLSRFRQGPVEAIWRRLADLGAHRQ